MVSQRAAHGVVIVMGIGSVLLAFIRTFVDQDLIAAMISISAAFTMYYAYRNPELLMARSFQEFGQLYDNSRDKKFLWGFPLYQLLMLSAALYILLV